MRYDLGLSCRRQKKHRKLCSVSNLAVYLCYHSDCVQLLLYENAYESGNGQKILNMLIEKRLIVFAGSLFNDRSLIKAVKTNIVQNVLVALIYILLF